MFIIKEKNTLFIANTSDSVSLKLKLAILGQKWEVSSRLRHHNISSSLDGIDGSKPVKNASRGINKNKGSQKLKDARIFSTPRVLIVTKNLEPGFLADPNPTPVMKLKSSQLCGRWTQWTVNHTTWHYNPDICSTQRLFPAYKVQYAVGSRQYEVCGSLKLTSDYYPYT